MRFPYKEDQNITRRRYTADLPEGDRSVPAECAGFFYRPAGGALRLDSAA